MQRTELILILLAAIALLLTLVVVLCAVACNLWRVKRHEDGILRRKTNEQLRLMHRYSRLKVILL